ncbi:MAG: HPr family phosphocarrier protein [Treponema sp.]|jgi:phosphocarrier protein|nr:HPr family phosphocarrier protein [Treponema sp.]
MISFDYTITGELGIHARPAGILIREVKKHKSRVLFFNGKKKAEGIKLFAIMQLGIKYGSTLGVIVEGSDEAETAAAIKQTLETYL